MADHRGVRPELVGGGRELPGEQQHQGAHQGDDQQSGQQRAEAEEPRVGEQEEHRMPAVGRGHPAWGSLGLPAPGGRGAHMADPRRRDHEDAMPGGVDAPTQVEVVAEHR